MKKPQCIFTLRFLLSERNTFRYYFFLRLVAKAIAIAIAAVVGMIIRANVSPVFGVEEMLEDFLPEVEELFVEEAADFVVVVVPATSAFVVVLPDSSVAVVFVSESVFASVVVPFPVSIITPLDFVVVTAAVV